jgi:hypothetical protein
VGRLFQAWLLPAWNRRNDGNPFDSAAGKPLMLALAIDAKIAVKNSDK